MTAGEQLQHYLNRFFALRQHGDDTVFLSRLQRLQDWQSQRLSHTHRHLLDDPATAEGIRFLLISGKPIQEPVAWQGPIVMNTQEQLHQAFTELRQGTFIKDRGTL